ncbi:hypothetical protein [Rhizobium grahamii]|uniref:Uncharacterized protein n=1 Tax=Rhizobium grahamii CCGE 502 TaxID=990285 RepID=S3HU10_9HYPH|nr:hypothetical protein [Rhizobium grahamii]EPE96646.1 hypothetical protein RGCCGE502_18460 [Rhizobium grahamii CCGE 502]
MQDAQFPQEWTAEHLESPFAETVLEQSTPTPSAVEQLSETVSPFAEAFADLQAQFEEHGDFEDILGELHDETFNEALAYLADETERDICERFAGETGQFQSERERYGEARLAEVRYEAEHYLDTLAEALANQDLGSLGEDRLSEVLDRFDPALSETTPAGEEFIGALVRKAKKVVKTVVNTAKKIGSLASPLLAPVLAKLRGLVQPLLRRVLSFAIGRLPAQLQSAARQLASRMKLEAELEEPEATTSPANLIDVEALAEGFDAALAEAVFAPAAEDNEYGEIDEADHGNSLAALAEARGMLIDNLREAGEKDNLAPAIEQFVPALLGALRLGIRLVGRPKVVGFLAGYLSKLIGRWVEPRASGALSSAIADAGLKLMTLEAEDRSAQEAADREAAPVALATVVEDTIRRLAEHEEFVFDNEDLMQLAAAESFSQAIATHFPPRFVRADLQRAPTLDGTFLARRPRNLRAYRKFSRVPEVDVTSQLADEVPTFGGATLGSTLRAAGATLPMRARMHIYQAAPGTTLASIGRLDRTLGSIRGALSPASFHPLTPQAAGLLLREPKLGTSVSKAFLRTPNRIGAGQRFYVLQPADGMSALPVAGNPGTLQRLAPSRAWLAFNGRKGTALVGIYFSESEAQQTVSAIRKGNKTAALLRAIVDACGTIGLSLPSRLAEQERVEVHEEFAGKMARLIPPDLKHLFRRRLASWVLPAISNWTKANGETFARAAGHPDPGVTIRIRIEAPLFAQIPQAIKSGGLAVLLRGARATPSISISVTPGRRRNDSLSN